MKQLDIEAVKRWTAVPQATIRAPASIGTLCPHCAEKVTLTTQGRRFDQARHTLSCSSRCPSCGESVHFWLTELAADGADGEPVTELYMRPTPADRLDATRFEVELPDPVRRAYESTVDSYNSGNLTATAVLCRRTLEHVFRYRLASERHRGTLIEAIGAVSETEDFRAPLDRLALALGDGAELGALLDMEREPDRDAARALVELLDALITYLYVLPDVFERLDNGFRRRRAEPGGGD